MCIDAKNRVVDFLSPLQTQVLCRFQVSSLPHALFKLYTHATVNYKEQHDGGVVIGAASCEKSASQTKPPFVDQLSGQF